MKHKQHLIIIDPTAFSGGSKVATESILRLLDPDKFRITVLSADSDSWHWPKLKRVHLHEPKWLAQKEQGIAYFLRHLFIALNLLVTCLRFGRFDIGLGASGPGVDLALYLLKPLMAIKIIQLIHGPVASSRTIARCLLAAEQVYYLESSRSSLINCLACSNAAKFKTLPANFHIMHNGLSEQLWPTPCQRTIPTVFWAASLLKWKGLETLLTALQKLPVNKRPTTHICYIRPKETKLPTSQIPENMTKVNCYENPLNLDQIRAGANIFVSTSKNEPFGLSILEAMAAGHCILIPADGAYWDRTLKNNVNCVKYQADSSDDLKQKLLLLNDDMAQVIKLGQQAAKVANNYAAKKQYANIKKGIEQSVIYSVSSSKGGLNDEMGNK
jgi:glycosyltransferase involved in cell wall biosynthesis